jgi:UDP-MurNAc hydroxylase
MDVHLIGNACQIVTPTQGSTRLLCDPWIHNGAFEGSWCHVGPLPAESLSYPRDFDLIYVSHIHPDHYDEQFLRTIDRSCVIVIPAEKPMQILSARVKALGFTDVIELSDRQSYRHGELTMTSFAPFQPNRFHEGYKLQNFIDSALLISDGQHSVLDTNDNFPTPTQLRQLEDEFGAPDLLQILYNSAGFYPQCVDDLTPQEKRAERNRVVQSCFDKMLDVARSSRCTYVMPFAGDFILGGRLSSLNEFLATSTPQDASAFLARHGVRSVSVGMGGRLCVETGRVDPPGKSYRRDDILAYAEIDLAGITYAYEQQPVPESAHLRELVRKAELNLRRRLERFDVFPDWHVSFRSALDDSDLGRVSLARSGDATREMICTLDDRLLLNILERRAHWDNAQVGSHIRFSRSCHPEYSQEVHTLLSFLHT